VFPLSYDGGQTYQTSGFLPAINANTQNRELAFDFLQFMVSKEMMVSPEQLFCAVNRNAVAEKAALDYESTLAGGYAPEGFDEEALENNLVVFDRLAAKLNVLADMDPKVIDFLYEELGKFFQGAISAGEACEGLQSKLSMYLNE
ncbi:MAG: hypothetical protein LBV33_05225, partial [Lachnospiraceae bacterium]|jgi:ABC-type glycerol-3-phosphate transport system substrate-binding protein|nr:hypothetical protein [Lachnospiraceae bacterium]